MKYEVQFFHAKFLEGNQITGTWRAYDEYGDEARHLVTSETVAKWLHDIELADMNFTRYSEPDLFNHSGHYAKDDCTEGTFLIKYESTD